jgi:1-acyl-sn-glycerol-3-phosphate acyltransferase
MGRMMARAGAVDGTRDNALHLLAQGELVLTYPGGVREIMRSRFGQERIHWQGRTGFAKVALAAGVPIIPVAGFGVNNGFLFVSSGHRLGKLLYRKILGLGPAYASYRDPLAIGLLPIPLPLSMAVHFPLPCKVRYVVGEPIYPAGHPHNREENLTEDELAQRAADTLRQMLRRKKNHLPIQPKRNSLRKVSP